MDVNSQQNLVDFLASKGCDVNFDSLRQLAKALSIQNYTGCIEQDKLILDFLKVSEFSQSL